MPTVASSPIASFTLADGMPLLVEPLDTVRSVALTWLLPLGAACFDPAEDGHAPLLAELVLRGAGGLDAREHSDALDRLGVQRSCCVSTHHLQISATMLGSRLEEALPLIAAMVTAPALPEAALPAARSLCIQSLESLDDDPQEKVMLKLKERHRPAPFNRNGYGVREVLQSASAEALRASWSLRAKPGGSILGIAGAVDPERVRAQLEQLLAGWRGAAPAPRETAPPMRGSLHIAEETAQAHIALGWDAPREADPTSMRERLLVRVLGGGSSSRLFTEVRERRGLCYSVFASYSSGRDSGMVTLYAGSTPQRAQQTLEVAMEQVESLRRGVAEPEFRRAVTGLKSRLVMQGESTAARAASIAGDQFRIGRPRSLAEIAAEVDAVTADQLNEHAARRAFAPCTLVCIGPDALRVPGDAGRV